MKTVELPVRLSASQDGHSYIKLVILLFYKCRQGLVQHVNQNNQILENMI